MANQARGRSLAVFASMLIISILAAVLAYRDIATVQNAPARVVSHMRHISAPIPARISPSPTPTPTPTIQPMAAFDTASVLGIGGRMQLEGISWERIDYATCGSSGLSGAALQNAVTADKSKGVHVLLLLCQGDVSGPQAFAQQQFDDIAQAGADVVQCGQEQMKQNAQPATYMAPADFARFYDLCSSAVYKAQPSTPVLMGSLDPQVSEGDSAPLTEQLNYVKQMQSAMNTVVRPGGNWQWRSQAIGLIDDWHNGYPNQYTNNLSKLFVYWGQQFGVDVQSGDLGKHLWVVEGSSCFQDCGLDPTNLYQIAVSHILTLITDVQTSLSYKVPFFYSNAQDVMRAGILWPTGVLGLDGNPKPIRQDLPMGARTLKMNCLTSQEQVADQVQLLAKLYQSCTLPADYLDTLNN